MATRKRKLSDSDSPKKRVCKRVQSKLPLPELNTIKDIIALDKSGNSYHGIDMVMLKNISPYLEELNEMIGMTKLKETIFLQIIYYLQGMHLNNKEGEYLHTIIVGPPGHGKTVVASIIGHIYSAAGLLETNNYSFTVASRTDFIGEFLGTTAIKTQNVLESCIGGVLFIDEVYSLVPVNHDKDSFAKEAVDTINAFLSEHKNDMCCIIAGYERDVFENFLTMNKGLPRRFPWVHRITEYETSDLTAIFLKMIKDIDWKFSFTENELSNLIRHNKSLFKHAGGDIETILTKSKMMHAKRILNDSDDKFNLSIKDIEMALEYITANKKDPNDSKLLYMYM